MTAVLSRRDLLRSGAALGGWLIAGDLLVACGGPASQADSGRVRFGFISAYGGSQQQRRQIERNSLDLAVAEMNAQGGVGGRPVDVVQDLHGPVDGQITRLFQDQGVDAVIGSLAAADHDRALAAVARQGGLLMVTSTQPAGDCSGSLVCAGAVAAQQAPAMLDWVFKNVGHRVYVLAMNDRWSAASVAAVRAGLQRHHQAPMAVRTMRSLGDDLQPAIADIMKKNPDVVWSLLDLDNAVDFATTVGSSDVHALVVSSAWDELLASQHPGLLGGALTSQAWFMSLDTPESRRFVSSYQHRFGAAPLNAGAEATYVAAQLYGRAAESAGTKAVDGVRAHLASVELQAPRGAVRVDSATRAAVGGAYVGQVTGHGTIDVHDRLGRPPPSATRCGSR